MMQRIWRLYVNAANARERVLRALRPNRPRFVTHGWPLRPDVCPCDVDFVGWLAEREIRRRSIFHLGTGAHHLVGIENHSRGWQNEVDDIEPRHFSIGTDKDYRRTRDIRSTNRNLHFACRNASRASHAKLEHRRNRSPSRIQGHRRKWFTRPTHGISDIERDCASTGISRGTKYIRLRNHDKNEPAEYGAIVVNYYLRYTRGHGKRYHEVYLLR